LGEGSALRPRISAVDTSRPPRNVTIELDQPGYVAVLLVAPGHSATLLYPTDSITNNRFNAGTQQLSIRIPDVLVQSDSIRNRGRVPQRVGRPPRDSSILNPGRQPSDSALRGRNTNPAPLLPTVPTYLLLVTSPKPLVYQRIIDKTAGVSIPIVEDEALNAVAKAIKSTIPEEPREWAGYYHRIELRKRP
jgi:hypothetical protein